MNTRIALRVSLPMLLVSVAAVAQDWPCWRGPQLDGVLRGVDPFSQPFDLRVGWSRTIGAGYSGIVAADGAAVTMFSDGESDFLGAFDMATGAERWRVQIGQTYEGRHGSEDGPSSTPCVVDGRVFGAGPHGRFLAVDLATGQTAWSVDLAKTHNVRVPWYGFGASPLPIGPAVFLPAGTTDGKAGFAFDRQSGKLLWSVSAGWVDYQPTLPLDVPDTLLVTDATHVNIVDARAGVVRARFEHRPGERDMGFPQIVPVGADRLLLGYQDESALFTFDRAADPPLRELWRTRDLRDSYNPPVVHGKTVFGLSGVFLVAIDLDSGARLWKSREPGARGLILVGEHLVLLANNGDVVVAEARREGYRETARIHVAGRGGFTAPIFAGGRILVRNTETLASIVVTPRSGGATEAVATRSAPPLGEFGHLVQRLREAQQPSKLLDEWWQKQRSFPVVENDSMVHFLYRGPAADVALLGDMAPDRGLPVPMERIPGTDVFYRSFEYAPDGLWQYAFLVDHDRVEMDPLNSARAPAVATIGGNPQSFGYESPELESVLRMPRFARAEFLTEAPGVGARLEKIPFAPTGERFLSTPRDVVVYLPDGYRADGPPYPVLYVLGGDLWLEHGHMRNALDHLMKERVAPAIVVFVPYHEGSRDRLDAEDHAKILLDQIVPLVDQRYRTLPRGAVLGAGADGPGALVAAFRAPERFPRVALQSPEIDPEELALIEPTQGRPEHVYLDWSRYETRVLDENTDYRSMARKLERVLQSRGCTVSGGEVQAGPGWDSWSSRLDRVLAALLPVE